MMLSATTGRYSETEIVADFIDLKAMIEHKLLEPVFQPIMDTELGNILGHEALIRGPRDSSLYSPVTLFKAARHLGLARRLDYTCQEIQCTAFSRYALPGKLFLNVSREAVLENENHIEFLVDLVKKCGITPAQIVIELSEQHPRGEILALKKIIEKYRSAGFEIAIDDLGAGYSGLRIWSEILPNYVKIDRHFIENVYSDSIKRQFVRIIKELGLSLGCRIVAEGIECEAEADALFNLGIAYQQGFYFAEPANDPRNLTPRCIQQHKTDTLQMFSSDALVGELCVRNISIEPSCTLQAVLRLFEDHPGVICLPVCENEQALGIVSRHEINRALATRFGWDLYHKRTAADFISPQSLLVEHTTPISQVSRLITDNLEYDLNLDFIVTSDNRYLGLVKPRALLRRITEQQIRTARYSNPLTGIPGNVPLNETLRDRLTRGTPFRVAYCDLDNFKPYNDRYGYSQGDDVIKLLCQTLLQESNPGRDQVFHVGGDDFVVVFTSDDWEMRCQAIVNRFNTEITAFYSQQDIEKGGITAMSRRRDELFFEIITVSIGVVHPDPHRCRSHHDVAGLAADAKHEAKKLSGRQKLFVSRRRAAPQ